MNPTRSPLRKIKLVALTPGGPGQAVVAANKWRAQYNPLRNLTITRAVAMREAAQRGDFADLQWTYFFIEQDYATLSALITSCESPLLKMDWQIKTIPDHKLPTGATLAQAEAQAATLRHRYDAIDNLRAAITHLHLANFRGFAHLQKHFDAAGECVHLECLNQWLFVRDGMFGDWYWNPTAQPNSNPASTLGETARLGGDALPGEDFIVRECPRPINRIALINFIRANLVEKDWDGFIEIYGIPGGVVTMPANVPQGREADYETAASRVAEGGSGAIPNGASYTPNDGPRGVDPFTPRAKHLEAQLILAGTGGKLTMLAESGSGTLAGGAHADTFAEIAEGRAQQISEVFQKQFDAPILAAEHAGEPVLAYFELCAEDLTDITALVSNVATLKNAGHTVDPEWIEEKTGYEITAADDSAPATAAGDGPTGGGPTALLANRQTEVGHPFAQAVAGDLAPVLARLQAVSEISDDAIFAEKLRQFYADFPALQTDVVKDPSAQRALLPVITQAFLAGLTEKSKGPKP